MPLETKVEKIQDLMEKADIPGLSMASITDGVIELTALGETSCGLYTKKNKPSDADIKKYDSSRYLLTDRGLYFYDLSKKEFTTVIEKNGIEKNDTEYDAKVKNIMSEISEDLTFQKFNEIPALKAHQLKHIEQHTGRLFTPEKIEANTQFGAASLSKPVFFYLILRIIEEDEVKKAFGFEHFDLDTKLVDLDLLPGFSDNSDLAKDITVGMALSHQTGVHDPSQKYDAPEILFEPGTQYGYSNFPLVYLQIILERKTKQSLEKLAQKYVFEHCKIKNSTFLKVGYEDSLPIHLKPNSTSTSVFPADIDSYCSVAANSLRTTAEDYAKFMVAWMKDEKLYKYLTKPIVKLTKDKWAQAVGIADECLENLAWGYGIGMQLKNDMVTAVFHNGDMNQWRAVITIDPINKTGTIFFSNSHNGDVLTQVITKEVIDAEAACSFMRDKLGFAMAYEDNWEANQINRMKKIDLVVAGKIVEAAELNLNRIKSSEGDVTSAEERLKNTTEQYEKAIKVVEQLTERVDQPIHSNRSSYSLMHSNLILQTPSPTPKQPSNYEIDITIKPPQSPEKEEFVTRKSSEHDSHKPKTPFDNSGPKPPGHVK